MKLIWKQRFSGYVIETCIQVIQYTYQPNCNALVLCWRHFGKWKSRSSHLQKAVLHFFLGTSKQMEENCLMLKPQASRHHIQNNRRRGVGSKGKTFCHLENIFFILNQSVSHISFLLHRSSRSKVKLNFMLHETQSKCLSSVFCCTDFYTLFIHLLCLQAYVTWLSN